jgi:cell division protein FtsQ
MDANGNSMPTDQFLLDLSLVTGYVTTEFAKENLLELAQFMNTQAPWNREIQQIHVTSNQRIELVPMKGEHIIVLGSSADVEDKMKRLGAFYDATSENMAWQRYATLDLSYEGQIVCKKKKNK